MNLFTLIPTPSSSSSQSATMDPISIKLDDDNFPAWKAEVLGKIKERNLEKFMTMKDLGGRPPKSSEEYKSWKEQDQVLLRVWVKPGHDGLCLVGVVHAGTDL